MNSLERRLQIGLAASLMLLMLLLGWLTSTAIQRLTDDLVLSRLSHDAESLVAGLQPDGSGALDLAAGRTSEIYDRVFSGHYYVVLLSDGRVLRSRSLWDHDLGVAETHVGTQRHWRAEGPVGQRLLVFSSGFRKQGQALTIIVAEDLSQIEQRLSAFNWYFAALAAFILVALAVVQRLVLRHSFRSLQSLREDIRRLEQGEVGQLSEAVPSEVQPLVREVNHLLGLLGQRLQRSRNALGNLAHAIKAPLSLLTQTIDRIDEPSAPELRGHVERIRELTERELKRARLAGAGTPGTRFDPSAELPSLCEVLRRIYHDKRLTIDCLVNGQEPFHADRDDMLELIGNLLDNACKWAGGRVRCEVQVGAALTIIVEDDGPGCSEDELAQLTRRGVRIDESVAGHGLGLAIVRDIVDLYRGQLHFERSAAFGGLRVSVELPSPAAAL